MKNTILLLFAMACGCVSIPAQTQMTKSSPAKLQRPDARRRVVRPEGSQPNRIYSLAIVTGELIFTSGQIGIDPKTGQMVEGGIQAELEQVFRNLTTVLEAAGSGTEYILKATVFLASMGDYNTMNELYQKHFKGDPPARTTVQVAALPRNARIEIEVVAIRK
jgi:2-iminobutanoate/2-iminopropanoate deaminase